MRKTMFAVLIVGSVLYADTARADFYIPVPSDGLALQLMTVNQFNNVLGGVGDPSSDAPLSSQPDNTAPQSNLTVLCPSFHRLQLASRTSTEFCNRHEQMMLPLPASWRNYLPLWMCLGRSNKKWRRSG
jgi:hypothetical protein